MFGFKHTMNYLDHDRIDHKVVRNKLNNRVLEVKGRHDLKKLYSYLLTRFEQSLEELLNTKEGGMRRWLNPMKEAD